MSKEKMGKIVRKLPPCLRRVLYQLFSSFHSVKCKWSDNVKLGMKKPQVLAFRLIGDKTTKILPLFKDLDANLHRSEIKINFKAYVSLTILTCLLASVFTLLIIPFLLHFVFHIPLFSSILFGIGGSLLAGAASIIGFYVYPLYRADNLKRALEDALPFTTGYMAILAGSGVAPDFIFRSLARVDAPLAVSHEARIITRDVELFGQDIISALEAASKRTPSEKFRELLEGFIATIHSGGDLVAYLTDRSRRYMRLKRIALRRFADTLAVLAEFYVTLLVAGPLLLVVMLAVMAMLGGGIGILDPTILLCLLTYIAIPVGSIVFLLILDVVSPKW